MPTWLAAATLRGPSSMNRQADGGICSDTLYIKLNDRNINYCKFCVSVEALRQLGLITVSCSDSRIAKVRVTQKADLDSAPVLVSLRSRTQTAKIKE